MYKLSLKNIVEFTNWWMETHDTYNVCTLEDVQEYFNLPKLEEVEQKYFTYICKMTKEEYLKEKKEGKINVPAAYEMFVAKNGKLEFESFKQLFSMWMSMYTPSCNKYYEYWDERLSVKEGE